MLPTYATPLVGRNIYLTEIARLLADPECRLLTLVGPGGIGKTRLAVEAAHRHQTCDAVYFVPLQQVASPELLPAAIASAVGLRTAGTGNPQQELLEQLRNKQWLLVLDNFDQLLEGATLLSAVLAVAPNLRLLVTSRLRLDVLEEFVLEIVGLACPFSEHDGNFERSGAVELFVQRARRVNSTFALTSAQRHAVFRIVHLVEGMPLGIELAANWVRALSCDTIADEIERNLDILESSGRNLEPRHRTMRAAFASTWQQLSPEEQDTFMRLSVFRSGFTRPAAAAVAGASLSLLSALIDKSLLRSDETDRFNVHELLRQYAQEWLERDAEAARCARDAHSAYYAGFLEARGDAITGTMQQRILGEVAAELDNIRAAWSWAVCQLHVDHLQRAAYTLYQFTDFRGAYREGIELFEQAKAALKTAGRSQQNDLVLAMLCALSGWTYIRIGDFEKSAEVFAHSSAVFAELNVAPPAGFGTDPLIGLAFLATVRGDYTRAISLAESACAQTADRGDTSNQQIGNYVQASAYCSLGHYSAAKEQAEQSYGLASADGNQAMMAYVSIILGDVVRAEGNLAAAQNHYQRSHDLHSQLDNPEGTAVALVRLAELASSQHNYGKAAMLFEQSIATYRRIQDPGGLAKSLLGLGDMALALGDDAQACAYFRESLKLAADIRWLPLVLLQFTAIGELLYRSGDIPLATIAWKMVAEHPATESTMQKRAQADLALAAADLGLQQGAVATGQGDPFTLATLLQDRLASWTAPVLTLALAEPQLSSQTAHSPAMQRLIEPLSEREVEILRLVALGMSNQEIANTLTLVVGTVKAHNHHIFAKLGVSNRVQALARARELNLLA